ncbi:MAG: DUF3177 family protein [Cyanobacteria bacterium J06648_11]
MNITPEFLEPLVWWDFRLAVGLNVFVPLVLLAWAFMAQFAPLTSVTIAYWRVSSLLAISVYLMIGGFPISFLTGSAARILIVTCLWYGSDAAIAIPMDDRLICRMFKVWRWIVTGYMGAGAVFSSLFVPCSFLAEPSATCQVWFQPPLGFKALLHPNIPAQTLGLVGAIGVVAYVTVFALFLWQERPSPFSD